MAKQVQYFKIADLIFSSPEDKIITLNGKEIAEIQRRFQEIVKSFETKESHYATNFIKCKDSKLPYNSFTVIGELEENLILHFTLSYKEPVLFIYNTNDKCIKNFIDIENSRFILNDETYEDVKEQLQYPRYLDRLFKNIGNINEFVERYQVALLEHNNSDCITGRECFEISMDDIEIGDDD